MKTTITVELAMDDRLRGTIVRREQSCRPINARWAAHFVKGAGWTLDHIQSGYAAAMGLKSFALAQSMARALDRKRGAKAWNFSDPNTVKGWTDCGKISAKYQEQSDGRG